MLVAGTALFVALGSGAYAQTQLARNSVTTQAIRDNAVTSGKIAPNAVVSSRIRDGQVRTDDLRDGNVTRGKLAAVDRTVWGVVRADGTLVRSSGEVTRIDHAPGTGRYIVVFNRAINGCAWVASTSSDNTTNLGQAEMQRNGTFTTSLVALTSRFSATPVPNTVLQDLDFQFVISCGVTAPPKTS
jgi:hypothetical protein